jgi:hypothetical protein
MSLGRAIVFTLGTVWGVLAAMALTSYPGNEPVAVSQFKIWSTLLLGLAGPGAWYLATHSEAGDRWTLAYLLAWVGWFSLGSLAVAVF